MKPRGKVLSALFLSTVTSLLYALPGPTSAGSGSSAPALPELSTGAIYSGLTILIGSSLIAADWIRRKRKDKK